MDQNCDVIWSFDQLTNSILTFADTNQWEDWFKLNKKNLKSNATKAAKTSNLRIGLNYKEKLEFESIESVIAQKEEALKILQNELNTPEVQHDFSKLSVLTQKISSAEAELDQLFARWEDLTKKNNEV